MEEVFKNQDRASICGSAVETGSLLVSTSFQWRCRSLWETYSSHQLARK